jgi:hypothetical protein
LIGCAFLEQDRFVLRHFFAPDFPAEAQILRAAGDLMERFRCLVTFNGKSYDLPLLRTRFTLQRRSLDTARWMQVDLLHIARTLWRRSLPDCALTTLERRILGFRRCHDIPSQSIPQMFFEFIRHKNIETLRGVFEHNAWDLLTSACLLSHVATVLDTLVPKQTETRKTARAECRLQSLPGAGRAPQVDHLQLARLYWSRGDAVRALQHCRLTDEDAGLELEGAIRKRLKDPAVAEVWEELVHRQSYLSLRAFWELSQLAEHRDRDPARALRLLAEWQARPGVGSKRELALVEKRKDRLVQQDIRLKQGRRPGPARVASSLAL